MIDFNFALATIDAVASGYVQIVFVADIPERRDSGQSIIRSRLRDIPMTRSCHLHASPAARL